MKKLFQFFDKQYIQSIIEGELKFQNNSPSCILCYLKDKEFNKPIESHNVSKNWQKKISTDNKVIECWVNPLELYAEEVKKLNEQSVLMSIKYGDSILKNPTSINHTSTFKLLCKKCEDKFSKIDEIKTIDSDTIRLLNCRSLLFNFYRSVLEYREFNEHIKSMFFLIRKVLWGVENGKGEYEYECFEIKNQIPFYVSDNVHIEYDLNNKDCRNPCRTRPYFMFIHVLPLKQNNLIIVSWKDGEQSSKFLKSVRNIYKNEFGLMRLAQRCNHPVFSPTFLFSLPFIVQKRILSSIHNNRRFLNSGLFNEDVSFSIQS